MVIVKEGLLGKNPEAKVTYGSKVVTMMTGNAFFPASTTVVSALGTTTTNLDAAIKNASGTVSTIKNLTKTFNVKMKAVVAHVQGVINEVSDSKALEMVESAGMEPSKKGAINITDLSAKQGKEAQSIKVRKLAEKKKVIYRFQICEDPAKEENWEDSKFSTKATVIIRDLISGTRYWIRVAIIRGDVQEDYCDPISIVVD